MAGSPIAGKGSALLTWTQQAANIATAVTLLFAAYQFRVSTQAQRIQNSLAVLSDGRQLEQQYQAGKAEARDVVAFYYRMYVSRDVLETHVMVPLERSICSSIIEDPRVGKYWDEVTKTQEKSFYIDDFVKQMDEIRSKKQSCDSARF